MSSSFFRTETSICGTFQSSLLAWRFIQDSLHLDWICSLTFIWLASKYGPDSSIVYRYRRRNTKFGVTNSTHFKFFWYFSWGWLQTFRRIWTKIFAGVFYTWSKDPLWSTNVLLVIHTCFGSKLYFYAILYCSLYSETMLFYFDICLYSYFLFYRFLTYRC